jgi:hypothetical protein
MFTSKTLLILTLSLGALCASHGDSYFSQVKGKALVGSSNRSQLSQEDRYFEASVMLPISEKLGFQLDGSHFAYSGDQINGFGAQLFWRNAEKLFALSYGQQKLVSMKANEISLKSEYYWDQFTLGAQAGVATIKYFNLPLENVSDDEDFFGRAYLNYYVTENLALTASIQHINKDNYYQAEVEYALPQLNLSLVAAYQESTAEFDQTYIGLRYYFGGKKNLVERHRKDTIKHDQNLSLMHSLGDFLKIIRLLENNENNFNVTFNPIIDNNIQV